MKLTFLNVAVAVGLMAGLIGKNPPAKDVVESTTTPAKTQTEATTTAPATTQPGSKYPEGPWSNVRLPLWLEPQHYYVELKPDLIADETGLFWFSGNSRVYFNVNESTDVIIIHSNKLNYSSVQVLSDSVSEQK